VIDVDPVAAMFNPGFFTHYVHMLFAALVTTGFAVAAVYAAGMLKGRRDEYHRKGLAIGLALAGIMMPIQLVSGDLIATQVTKSQPLKLATMEALFETTEGAPLTLFGIPDEETRTVKGGIEIPYLLSILAYGDPNATVQGMEAWPEDEWPNVMLVHSAYNVMITLGSALILPGLVGLYAWRRRPHWLEHRLFLWGIVASAPAAFICVEAGWITTESGRQPWVVYGILKTEDSFTTATGILPWFIVFSGVYVVLTVLSSLILLRMAARRRARLAGEVPGG